MGFMELLLQFVKDIPHLLKGSEDNERNLTIFTIVAIILGLIAVGIAIHFLYNKDFIDFAISLGMTIVFIILIFYSIKKVNKS